VHVISFAISIFCFRQAQNYLHGVKDIQINVLMLATAWNLKKQMEITGKNKGLLYIFFLNTQTISKQTKI
jgi:hypothetical protein